MTLDEAWAEAHRAAEALFGEPQYIAVAGPEPWHASWDDRSKWIYRAECGMDFSVRGAESAAAALHALAERLSDARSAVSAEPEAKA